MESKNQTGDQEQKVDYDNLEQYTKRELLNICTDLNLTVNKSKNKSFIISKIQARINGFCETLDCSEKAVVSNSNGKRVCLEHQTGRKYCAHEGCKTRPYYGLEGQKPLYCVDHKKPDMVDVVNKTCLYEGCTKIPSYGLEGQKALYCKAHKQADMVDVGHKTCLYEGCKTIPKYGFQGQKPLYCKAHKQPDMVEVVNKTCLYEGCQNRPQYGLEGQKALYCKAHKQPDMVNLVSKTCLYEGCQTKNTQFGTHLTGRIHCAKHYNKKTEWKLTTCKSTKCRRIATHSETGNYPYELCDDHCPNNYRSNLTSTCINCNLSDLICDEEGRCLLACSQIHKDRVKFSETELSKFLSRSNLEFSEDRIEDSSCSKKRPDFVFRTPYGVVIVENDENQHRSYPCECEQARMIQIHQDFGESVHFIRFNPDRYRSESENLSLQQRHKILLTKVLKPILNQAENFFIRNQGLTVRYMYYDNCDGQFRVQIINY